jgi:glycine/D-amino acid oxidase-like deaminating enzyme
VSGTGRVIVVGAGVTGLLTAIECALAGHRVTVLDRGAIPNPRSSSFDQHRALRLLAPGDRAGTARMITARRRWLELEARLAARFFRRVGIVTSWPRAELPAVTEFAAAVRVPVEAVEPEKLPHLNLPAGSAGLLEADAGVLLAERVLRAAARWLAERPEVTLRPWSQVRSVDVDAGRVCLDGAVLDADAVLLATGPWTPELVELPAVLHRQTMVYLRPPLDRLRWWEHAPGAGRLGADGRAWLLPPGDGALLKLSTDAVCREVSTVDGGEAGTSWVDRVLGAGIVPGIERYTTVAIRHCHYLSGGEDGLITRLGRATWSRTACGGSGFGSAPLAASELVAAMEDAA